MAGFGVSGFAAADNLTHLGATVTALADDATPTQLEKAQLLEILGATVRLHAGATQTLPDDADLLVVSPGFRPDSSILVQARERGVPIWGEVELAWRLRDPDHDTPWLCVTGTNGKTTTVRMLDGILRAAGLHSQAAGNVGLPIVEAVMDPTPYDVLAVELSSFQLHYTDSMRAESAAVLNVAEDHLDWYAGPVGHGRLRRRQGPDLPGRQPGLRLQRRGPGDRAPGPGGRGGRRGASDRLHPRHARRRDGRRRRRHPGRPRLHRAAATRPPPSCARSPTWPRPEPPQPAPHVVANALAAAALARAHGVSQAAVRDGLRGFRPDAHRIAVVAERDGITWVDDSKATNPHAAQSSLQAYDPVVWVAGGLAKGAAFDDLVQAVRGRLRGVVLLGRDRAVIAAALSRHAPDVRVIEVDGGETGSRGR